MPNHVTNRLKIEGPEDRVKAVLAAIGRDVPDTPDTCMDGRALYKKTGTDHEYGSYDAAKNEFKAHNDKAILQGVPEGWEPVIIPARREVIDFNLIVPAPDTPAYRDEPTQDEARKDPTWWYNWNVAHWGTKWNAYGHVQTPEGIKFDTAWSWPRPIAEALAAKHPDLRFTWEYVDEGWNFAGRTVFSGGKQMSDTDIACRKDCPEFCALCAALKGYDPAADEDDSDENDSNEAQA